MLVLKTSKGFSLIELTVAALLMAIMTASVFSVVLSSRLQKARADPRLNHNIYAQAVLDALRNYVAYDPAKLPNNGRWAADTCAACGGGNCWALKEDCAHDVSTLLPAEFRFNYRLSITQWATLKYTVTILPSGGRTVTVTMDYALQ